MEITIDPIFPVFFKCDSQAGWEALNNSANLILGYPSEQADTYSDPIIDKDKNYWFLVNQEVSELVDLAVCVAYENI